jgi:hypothetical protein
MRKSRAKPARSANPLTGKRIRMEGVDRFQPAGKILPGTIAASGRRIRIGARGDTRRRARTRND